MNYLPLLLAAVFMNLPRTTVQNLSSKRVLALIRGVNALKKSGILDLLKTENPMDALLSGAIKPEQVFPVVAAFAPLLHGDLPSSSATPQPSSPSAVPQEKAVEKLFPCELKELFYAVAEKKKE